MNKVPGPLSARRKLKAALRPNEEILLGARCEVRGVNSTGKRMIAGALALGVPGAAISGFRDITPAKGAIIVTGDRVLVAGGVGGIFAQLILDVDRKTIVAVTANRAIAYRNVRLQLAGGEEFEFRVYRRPTAEKIVEMLHS